MIGIDVNDTIVIDQQKALEAALSTDPKMEKALRKHIRMAIDQAREEVVKAARDAMDSDPRGTANAVHRSVYKKVLGANINIYNSRKAGGSVSTYEPPRKLQPKQRGGNRMVRGERTKYIMGLVANARGFILRFLNSGTDVRYALSGRMGNTEAQRKKFLAKNNGRGHRGQIPPNNWFKSAAESEMVKAVDILANLIEEELEKVTN